MFEYPESIARQLLDLNNHIEDLKELFKEYNKIMKELAEQIALANLQRSMTNKEQAEEFLGL